MGVLITAAIAVGFFLAVWAVSYWSYAKHSRLSSHIILITSAALLAAALLFSIGDLAEPASTTFLHANQLTASIVLGRFAFLWGLCAGFLILVRTLFLRLAGKIAGLEVVRRTLMLAKRHHNLFGWVTLAAAGGHGLYFAFHPAIRETEVWSGLAAWGALLGLTVTGLWMQRKAPTAERKRLRRAFHISLTVGYVALLALHFLGSLFISVLLIAGAFAAMGALWVFLRASDALRRRGRAAAR